MGRQLFSYVPIAPGRATITFEYGYAPWPCHVSALIPPRAGLSGPASSFFPCLCDVEYSANTWLSATIRTLGKRHRNWFHWVPATGISDGSVRRAGAGDEQTVVRSASREVPRGHGRCSASSRIASGGGLWQLLYKPTLSVIIHDGASAHTASHQATPEIAHCVRQNRANSGKKDRSRKKQTQRQLIARNERSVRVAATALALEMAVMPQLSNSSRRTDHSE
jgi:hypothetical protein